MIPISTRHKARIKLQEMYDYWSQEPEAEDLVPLILIALECATSGFLINVNYINKELERIANLD